ncbi:MAG: helix-turn-helix domain-containing protein [Eubacterium sp.]|nr:helix-turn-helix domain-containing protein [Eubacterium sp.]
MMEYNQFNIGVIIQKIRKSRDITQFEMAEKLDISVDHYSKMEQGAEGMSLGLVFKLMTILDVDANTLLLFGEEDSNRSERLISKIYYLNKTDRDRVLDSFELMVDSMSRLAEGKMVS